MKGDTRRDARNHRTQTEEVAYRSNRSLIVNRQRPDNPDKELCT